MMRAFRVDVYLGAVTEIEALFYDRRHAEQYIKSTGYPWNYGIQEIELPEDHYMEMFKNEIKE